MFSKFSQKSLGSFLEVSRKSIRCLLEVSLWESLGRLLGVSWESCGSLSWIVSQQSLSSLSEVTWQYLNSLSALSFTSLALSFLIHFIILRAYFIKPAEHKIPCLVFLEIRFIEILRKTCFKEKNAKPSEIIVDKDDLCRVKAMERYNLNLYP